MRILRQSTAIKVPFGPMVDATDGATLETAIAWASGEAALIKNDSGTIVNIGTNTFSSHLGGGMYNVSLSASDTDTLGLLTAVFYDTAARPVKEEFMVVPAAVYDSLVAGSDKLPVDAAEISGSATAADNIELTAGVIVSGTVQSGSTTTLIKTNLTEVQNDHYNGRTIIFSSGTQNRVSAAISDYDGASKSITISAIPAAPSAGDTFVIV